jgi:hypothetical protein
MVSIIILLRAAGARAIGIERGPLVADFFS